MADINVYLRTVPSDTDRNDVRLYDPTAPAPAAAGTLRNTRISLAIGPRI